MATDTPQSAPETLSDLASFLEDNPMTGDPQQEEDKATTAPAGTDDNADTPDEDATQAPADDDQDEGTGDDDADTQDDQDDEPEKQTRERKFKVTTKGEDGADQELEVTEAELVKGYMRQADYSRSKETLARQSEEAFKTMTGHIEARSNQYLEQSQKQLLAIHALAGLRTPQEMAVLAQSDPGAWVQEQQRERAIAQVINQIEANMSAERQQLEQQRKQEAQQIVAKAWGVLGQAGFDKPKLTALFEKIKADYGIPQERFDNINDPKLVFIMRDAAAYRELQAKKPAVTQKAKEAPRLPPPRQSTPPQTRMAKRLDDRFKSGRAKVGDLAAYIAMKNI